MAQNKKNYLKADGDKEIKIVSDRCDRELQRQSAKEVLEMVKQRDQEQEKVYTIPIFKGFKIVSKEAKEKWIKQQKKKEKEKCGLEN